MRYRLAVLLALCCSSVMALDFTQELAGSPNYLLVTSSRPELAETRYTKPTGKFKILADDVLRRVQPPDSVVQPQAWTATRQGKQGLVIVYPVTYDLRITDLSCDTCPNSVFAVTGYGTDQPWINQTLETWTRLDHGWNDKLAREMLRTVQVTKVQTDMLCVEFPHVEVKKYLARLHGLDR